MAKRVLSLNLAKRILSLNLAKKVLSLDIDSAVIRLMETKGGRIMKWASLPLKRDVVKNGVVLDPQALGIAIKQLMNASGIKGRTVAANVSGLYSVNRILKRTNMPGKLITEEAVQASAQEIMPLPLNKLYLSWKSIQGKNDGEQEQVLLVGVPHDTIDAEVQALRSADIRSSLLDYKALALARAVNKAEALILNIESDSFDMILVARGLPEIMHTNAWKPDELTMEQRVEYLAVKLELAVGFYNSHHPEGLLSPKTPLIILEKMTGDVTLKEKLQARLEYSSEPLVPPLECPANMPVSQYAVNIGLSLKKMATSKNPLNGRYLAPDIDLLPKIYRPWKPSARQIFLFCLIMALIALLFPLYGMTSAAMAKTASIQTSYRVANQKVQQKQLIIKNRLPMENAIRDYSTILDKHGGFSQELNVIMGDAGKPGIHLSSVDHQGKNIIISAAADDYTVFRNYIAYLEASGQFSIPIKSPPEQFPYNKEGKLDITPKKIR